MDLTRPVEVGILQLHPLGRSVAENVFLGVFVRLGESLKQVRKRRAGIQG